MFHPRTTTSHFVAALSLCLASLGALAADAPAHMADGMLVDHKGMALYSFDKDAADKSNCNGPCAKVWPPLAAAAGDQPMGAYGIVTREDGTRQWSYKSKPLYLYQADQKAGDHGGDNFKDVWHLIKE
jgi:predicted lipoprotein with Yx(FWY)xxD motif